MKSWQIRRLSGEVLHMIRASSMSCSRPSDWKDRLTPGEGKEEARRGKEGEGGRGEDVRQGRSVGECMCMRNKWGKRENNGKLEVS